MTRSPLIPWTMARESISQSHVLQRGVCHRRATNPKFTRATPPPKTCMTRTWPTASTSSSRPETRMNTHHQNSAPRRGGWRPARWGGLVRGPSSRRTCGVGRSVPTATLEVLLQDVANDDERDRDHPGHEDPHRPVDELAVPVGRLGPEVDDHDPQAVEAVVDHGGHQPELQQPDERVLVEADNTVVGVGPPAHQRGVHDVGEQEEDDGHPGDPVGDPGPLALPPLVEAAELAAAFELRS